MHGWTNGCTVHVTKEMDKATKLDQMLQLSRKTIKGNKTMIAVMPPRTDTAHEINRCTNGVPLKSLDRDVAANTGIASSWRSCFLDIQNHRYTSKFEQFKHTPSAKTRTSRKIQVIKKKATLNKSTNKHKLRDALTTKRAMMATHNIKKKEMNFGFWDSMFMDALSPLRQAAAAPATL